MSKTEKHIDHLTLVHIKNYLEDRLDNQTRHTVERHLLDCEFCKEAFEGYQRIGMKEAEADVFGVNIRLSKRVGKSFLGFSDYRYYGIAASVLLLIGTMFYIFEIGQEVSNGTVAQDEKVGLNETEEDRENEPEALSAGADTTLVAQNIVEEAPRQEAPPEVKKEVLESISASDLDLSNPAIASGLQSGASGLAAPGDQDVVKDENEIVADQSAELAMADEVSSQVAGDSESDLSEIGDIAKEEAIAVAEIVETEPQAAPIAASQAVSEDLDNLVVVESKADESETLARKKQKLSATGAVSRSVSGSDPEPIFGKDNYLDYLESDLKYPEEARANNIEGVVIVRFTVAVDGSLSDFVIDSSLGYGCDEEAIRLIKDGEQWVPALNNGQRQRKETSLPVKFNL